MPVIRAFETALNQGLLLESERHRHYFAFDTTELLKGDILKRYQAYQIGLANNFLQADEVRYKEDLKPLGFNFIRLGLQDVLLDPKTNTIYTPNTNQTTMFGQNVNQQVADSMIEETEQRWDGQPRDSDGRFDKGKRRRLVCSGAKRKNSEKSSKRLEKSDKNDIIKSRNISGALNPFSPAAEKHATQYYESVRHMKTDTIKISEATGIAKHKIDKIKNHVFISEHNLIDGKRRFDPDYEMAQSWQRLISGKFKEQDVVLLKHEYAELRYMEKGFSQNEAHIKASRRYNFAKYCD